MPTPTNVPFRPTLDPRPPPTGGPPPPPEGPPAAPTPPADRSRAGATWVTATGAFLLLVAAAVFVAVQWDHIPDGLKLAVLGTLTGGFLLAGRRLRPVLPATAGVLYHLGAFLLPVTSAAVVVTVDVGWPTILLIEGLVASVGFAVLNRVERSVVLDWATVAGVVVLAAGIGATTPVPAPLALVGFAGVAEWRRRHGAAIAWAMVAGLGPVITAAAHLLLTGGLLRADHGPSSNVLGVLDRLGLTRTGVASHSATAQLGSVGVQVVAAVVGLGAGAVLARNASRRRSLELVVVAGLSVLVGLGNGWSSLGVSGPTDLVGVAGLFLLIELGAWATAGDDFWARPARVVAAAVEVLMAVVTTVGALAGLVVVAASDPTTTSSLTAARGSSIARWLAPDAVVPVILVATALAVVAWLVADLRRRTPDRTPPGIALLVGGGWLPATIAASATALAGLALATSSALVVGVAAVAIAALLVLSGRPGGHALAVILAVPAPFLIGDRPVLVVATAAAATVILAAAAVVRSRVVRDELEGQSVWLLAGAACLPVASAIGAGSARFSPTETTPATIAALLSVAVLWIGALVLDRAGSPVEHGPRLDEVGLVPRVASALALVAAPLLGPGGVALVAGALAILTLADAGLRRRWWMAVPTGPLACIAAGATTLWAGGTLGQTALAVLAVGAAATAVDALAILRTPVGRPSLWSIPLWCAQGASVIGAATLASGDRGAFGTVLLVSGAVVLGYGVRLHRSEVQALGGGVATIGIWLHLLDHHVTATEPYLAPVALALVVTGWQVRRSATVSSWVAYGPAISLLGGAALLERLHDGAPVHALVAGMVGLVAVVVGGRERLIAPLVLGTGLLVALAVNESLAVTAGVPTWGWLALGGSVLVASGIAMERAETSPIETGRRVVDAVGERFS